MAWLQDHFKDLLTNYAGLWVAVHGGDVVASDADRDRLLSRLRSDPDFNVFAVQLTTPEPIDLHL